MHSSLATPLYGPAPGPRSGPRLHQPRPNWIGPGLLIQPTCHLCCYHHGPHYHADRRCSMAHTTAHESNRECGALDPRALGHVEHSGPETGPFQVSAGSPRPSTGGEFPVVIVPILAPGWAGTRIRGAPRLASGARSTSPAHRLSKPSPRGTPWQAPLGLRPHRPGQPDATTTQQVGRAFPSHPTLLSVGGCKTGFDSPEQLHNSIHIAKGRGRKLCRGSQTRQY